MRTRAAVAVAAGKPLQIMEVNLADPREGEVLVEIKATGICHTDEFTLSGADPEGLFPAILGHEGAGVVVDVGPGVTSVKKGDHVIPLYTPECRECKSCTSHKTNLCTAIRATQGKGLMPDGTSRFSIGGEKINYVVLDDGSDTTKAVTKEYGVLKTYMGVMEMARRDTYIIDPQGRVAKHYESVNPDGHSKVVLEDLKALKK